MASLPQLPEALVGRVSVKDTPGRELALGGGLEGAERTSRETANWVVPTISPDRAISRVKEPADARVKDMVVNDGYARGAVQIGMDSVVGAQFRLNSKILWEMVPGGTAAWAVEAQKVIEQRFRLIGESESCWLDAAGMNTFTGLIRLSVASFIMTGEVLMTSEWDKSSGRPLKTCFQSTDPARLRNPDWKEDDQFLRRGVKVNHYGKPIGYHIQKEHPSAFYYNSDPLQNAYIPRYKPWGRPQVFHIIEQLFPDQHRGVADMVAVLKRMRMTKHLQDVVLQNAVINATYCAAIESEMPTAEMIVALGGDMSDPATALNNAIGAYLSGLQSYLGGAGNIALDGAMIPHLYPGTKLQAKTLGTPGAVGTDFEASLLRHTAAGLGIDYAEFSRDYSKMSYATAKLSDAKTVRGMNVKKKNVADRIANLMYGNVVEEMIARDEIPTPRGFTRDDFYRPLVREAFTRATWIGSGRGQIDELKETQAAILRIKAGLSTREIEIARLGEDYREIFEQQAAEQKLMDQHGLVFTLETNKGNTGQGGDTGGSGDGPGNGNDAEDEPEDEGIDDDGSSDDS
jgi:lambda family phage portal protein